MIVFTHSNIDIIQGVIGYGNATEGITDWRITNTNSGIFNISNSSSIIRPSGGTSEIGEIPGSTDRYMIFTAGPSTFTVPSGGIKCDILIVGGGGGGGGQNAGGGGAGGLVLIQNITLSGNFTINIGSGGSGRTGDNSGLPGTNTTFTKSDNSIIITANGGGRGGNTFDIGGNGGSGGGGGFIYSNGTQTQKSQSQIGIIFPAIINQFGEDGGHGGGGTSSYPGGGGGGAGGVGATSGANETGQNGGLGIDRVGNFIFKEKFISSVGDNGWFAGGGGSAGGYQNTNYAYGNGGSTLFGGGGNGDGVGRGINGINGTGGGGGGARLGAGGGNGGSGIVIIRYSTANISIIDNGNVGFGITPTTNSSLVEIAGDVNITGNYRINNIDIINSTSNYVLSTSNLIVPRISTEVNNGSNYASSINTVLNTRINDTSNYIMTTNSLSTNQVTSKWTSTSSGIYYNTPISETVTLPSEFGKDMNMIFTYTTETAGSGTGQTQYTINAPSGGILYDILIIGGGGNGGNGVDANRGGGGGGAGGLIYIKNISLTGTYTINVGNNEKNSSITTTATNQININGNLLTSLIATGGGRGGTTTTLSNNSSQVNGNGGGSGGGGADWNGAGANSTQNTYFGTGFGFKGGNSSGMGFYDGGAGAGGGGAGGEGANQSGYTRGLGGVGKIIDITGTLIEYAVGGDGSTIWSNNGLNGINNRGNGGSGGGRDKIAGGTGGTGVVIIRFSTFLPLTVENSITSTPEVLYGVTTGTIETDRYIILTYTADNTGTGQTQYNINVPTDNIICDILMVGGGGAGGKDIGGGGGGGAVLYGTNISIPKTSYIVKVGRGATPGEVRGKSTEGFGAIVLGGGSANNLGWGTNTSVNGNTGGSGGGGKGTGGGTSVSTGGVPGISTKGAILASSIIYNGYSGGSGMMQLSTTGNAVAGGGGGGTNFSGINANTTTGRGGDGGDGIEINIIGISYCWGAGGGGSSLHNTVSVIGGNGGKGGGGSGGSYYNSSIQPTLIGTVGSNGYGIASGKNAGSGTGSGGGGAAYTDTVGGNGGSGIIIIRYRNKPSIANVGIGTMTPATDLHIYDDTINNTTLTIQNNYIDPITITPNTRHTVTETIENNKYYRTLTFAYNVSYPVLADDVNNLFAWYKLDGNLIDSVNTTGTATLPNGAITYTTDTSKFSNLPNYISATFNGTASATGAYALTPTIYKNVPLSFAFWFMTTGTAYYTMLGYGDKSTNSARIQFDFYLTSGTSYQLNVYTALNNQWTITPSATGLSLNTWYFCVYTLSNTSPVNCILYINGTQRATGTGNAGQYLSVTKDLTIGASGDGGRGFVGQLADIRIYNKVLSLAEITTLYTVNTPTSIVSTINFGVSKTIFVNGGSGVSVLGLYNISVGPTNSSVLKAQAQTVDPYPSTATTTISIKYEYKDSTLSLPKLIDVPGTTTTTIGTTDRCISFPYTSETIVNSGQTEYIFSPSESIICDILLVGGGGGGGTTGGSGGGGDVLEFNNINLDAGSYRILVGRGGVCYNFSISTSESGKISSMISSKINLNAAGGGGGSSYGAWQYGWNYGWQLGSPLNNDYSTTYIDPITGVTKTTSGGGGGTRHQGTSGSIVLNGTTYGGTGNGVSGYGGINIDNNENTGGAGGGAAPPPLGNGGNSSIGTPSYTGNGGKGISSYITGTLIEYGAGGAGACWNFPPTIQGSSSGGGGYQRGLTSIDGSYSAIYYFSENGRGGGGTMYRGGGSGIVIIRYRKVVSSASIELIRLSNNSVNEIVITGTTSTIVGTDRCIQFPYTTDSSGLTGQTQYSFSPTEALVCDILLVGGGGGGSGAGGGAGGYLYFTNISLESGTTYTVKVGNGGTGSVFTGYSNYQPGNQGYQSTFSSGSISYTAYGGGGGGANANAAPSYSGLVGSYGGTGMDFNQVQTYTSTQGNIGGNSIRFVNYGSGGGGGGAGAVGETAYYVAGLFADSGNTVSYSNGGKGGNGLPNSITGTTVYYAGGGTGGANTDAGTDTSTQVAPLGGGGLGSRAPNANGGNGTDGFGGGGGGGDWQRPAGARGGSGIVIMRYRKVANYKIGNFSGDFKIIATSTANNNTEYMRIAENGSSIYNATGSPLWSTVSDRRIKENIEKASYEKCYNNLERLELYRFNYISELNNINKDLKQLGYIAQEVNEIFPKSVSSQSLYNNTLSISDLLSIDITQINYTLFGSVKRLIELINNKILRLEKLENILNINNSGTSNLIVEELTSNIVVEQITSNLIVEELTSNIVVEQITSNIVVEPITSNLIVEQITSNIVVEQITSNLIVEPITSNLIVEELTSNIVVEELTSNIVVEQITSNLIVEPITSNLIVEELTSNIVVEQITSNIVVEPITSNLIVEELTSNIVVEQITSNIVVEQITSNLII